MSKHLALEVYNPLIHLEFFSLRFAPEEILGYKIVIFIEKQKGFYMKFMSFILVLIFSILLQAAPPVDEAQKGNEMILRQIAESREVVDLKLEHIPIAMSLGDLAALRVLLAKLKITQAMLNEFLFSAVKASSNEQIELFLEKGANPNARRTGVFIWDKVSISERNIDTLKLLIQSEANINARNIMGETPLHIFAKYGSPAAAQLLLDAGADVNAQNLKGETPYTVSASRTDRQAAEMMMMLMAYGGEHKSKWTIETVQQKLLSFVRCW